VPKAGQRPVRIGCSGWNYAAWKDEFYEGKRPRLWLQHYAGYFDTVEVNNTFYRLPLETSVARWVEETPPGFVFAVKANFRRDDERLAAGLAALPPGRHCFEFRHPSWFAEPVYELLRAHAAALVIGDRPEVKEFQTFEHTTDWTYVRFHHGSRGRRGNYSRSELEEWAQRFETWRRDVEIYAYFNNDWEGFAVRNALWLKRRLSS
jgi:uncharacterized protein YecE (DUF72 family)